MNIGDLYVTRLMSTTRLTASVTSQQLAPRDDNRGMLWIYNDSPAVMFVKLSSSVATNDFSFQVAANSIFRVEPPVPANAIAVLWGSASGSAFLTVG